jgi:hypothetical protein
LQTQLCSYLAKLMVHFPTLNRSQIGESSGRLANVEPLWTMASWMSSALVTITSVRWPICMLYREIVEHVGKDGVITESDVEEMSYLNALSAPLLHPLSLTLFFFFKKRVAQPPP